MTQQNKEALEWLTLAREDLVATRATNELACVDYIITALTPVQNLEGDVDILKNLLGKIRQKKGFYSASVGHSEVKQAHKTGILKGLDAAEKEIDEALAAQSHLSPASTRTGDGKCSKTGIPYAEAIKEMQEIIANCDAYGTRAKTPLPVRVRVLVDAIIEAASTPRPAEVESLDEALQHEQAIFADLSCATLLKIGRGYHAELNKIFKAAKAYNCIQGKATFVGDIDKTVIKENEVGEWVIWCGNEEVADAIRKAARLYASTPCKEGEIERMIEGMRKPDPTKRKTNFFAGHDTGYNAALDDIKAAFKKREG